MDEQAMQEYGQKPKEWNRSIHARLLNRLTDDKAKVVVFDTTLTQTNHPADDGRLEDAIRNNRRVVLAAGRERVAGIPLSYTITPILERFETNAAWGTAEVQEDPDQVVRRYLAGDDQEHGLIWTAATVAGAPVTRNGELRLVGERWLNYYGSAFPFEHLSMTYSNAETREAGYFRDRAVFIGGKPKILSLGEVTDVFG